MKTVKTNRGRGVTDYRAERKSQAVPKIMEEVKNDAGVVTHYLCEGNRLFTKEGYERSFGLNHGIKMRPKGWKGQSLDPRVII